MMRRIGLVAAMMAMAGLLTLMALPAVAQSWRDDDWGSSRGDSWGDHDGWRHHDFDNDMGRSECDWYWSWWWGWQRWCWSPWWGWYIAPWW